MWERIREIIIKELRQTFREPRLRAMLFVPPVIQLLVFGFAVNLDVDHARIAWMDGDRTPESRELLAGFQGSGRFDVVATPDAAPSRLLDESQSLSFCHSSFSACKCVERVSIANALERKPAAPPAMASRTPVAIQ